VRVLVTGGLGYLGHAVCVDLLAHGYQVAAMTSRQGMQPPVGADLVEADLSDRLAVQKVMRDDYDGVVHLAARTRGRESLSDPLGYWEVNVGGTLNILRGLRSGRRLVFASTNVVYGSRHVGVLAEDVEPHPESPYAASKLTAEQIIGSCVAAREIGAVSLRFFNIAGAVDGVADTDPTRIIPNTFRALTGELPHVTLNGDGSAVRDFVHVADCAAAVRLAIEAARTAEHRVYNIGSGIGTSMAEIVKAAQALTGHPVKVERMPPKPEPHTLIGDPALARRELGWAPTRSTLTEILASGWDAWRHRTP
jgi:UDP-glucose 4-epimerase